MIGIAGFEKYKDIITEFFQLFKTPWEFCRDGTSYNVILTDNSTLCNYESRLLVIYNGYQQNDENRSEIKFTDYSINSICLDNFELKFYCRSVEVSGGRALLSCQKSGKTIAARLKSHPTVVVGYNIFAEVDTILKRGQPLEYARNPSIDLHISILKKIILKENIPLVEIPPVPYGFSFFGCLTHDVDYVGIRHHFIDHSVIGFLYRAVPGSVFNYIKGRIGLPVLFNNLKAAVSLPFIFMRLVHDFWNQFDWYISHEGKFPSTYFISPFRNNPGEKVGSSMRAIRYQASDIIDIINKLISNGDEIGVHGIDSWHSVEKGKAELNQIISITGEAKTGIRMHWLCNSDETPKILEDAGFDYDSTYGYNETPGFKAGTFQPFVPPGCSRLLEIPMHIMDCSMLYPDRLNLTEKEACEIIGQFVDNCVLMGGVLSCNWHQRSPGPERNWGNSYIELIRKINDNGGFFATCSQIAEWFRIRREIAFSKISLKGNTIRVELENINKRIAPQMFLRIYNGKVIDIPVDREVFDIDMNIQKQYIEME